MYLFFTIVTTYLSFCAMRATSEADEKKWLGNFLKVQAGLHL